MGIERTFQKLDQAHIVIWLIDATGSTQDIEKIAGRVLPHCTDKRLIVAFNKIDKIGSATQQQLTDLYKRLTREKPNTSFIFLSASHDQNIDVLEKQLTDTIQSTQTGENDIIVTNARHYEALLNAHDAILRTLNYNPASPETSSPKTLENACTTSEKSPVKSLLTKYLGPYFPSFVSGNDISQLTATN